MRRLRPDLAAEHGVAMLVVLLALAAGSALAAVVLSAAGADLPFAKASQDRKQAYAAAEAGLEYYMFQLGENNDYWTLCDTGSGPDPSTPNPVNQPKAPNAPDTRRWRTMPDGTSQYTIELLPAEGQPMCVPGANAHQSMLDGASGTFRIRATGRSGRVTRSIVTTLRRQGFLDYIYFTEHEMRDPAQYPDPRDAAWAALNDNCLKPRAQRPTTGRPSDPSQGCQAIQFADDDEINGPFHTNDDILSCGSAKFGRDENDRIESGKGWLSAPGCGGEPDFQGTWLPNSNPLHPPPDNAALATVADPRYRYTGKTTIRLNGNTMDVTTGPSQTTTTGVTLPPNGVIYVNNGSCTGTKTPLLQRYDDPPGCAVVYLSGTYSSSLTIASANDIVIRGDVRKDPNADVVLGLIANNNVRVYHPVTRSNWNDPDSCTNATGTMKDVTIDAAILALKHSFVVDNFRCGAVLGKLNVTGAIAQKFRGAVATTKPTGYTKNYVYDDRLKYRSPPYYLDPIQAAWRVNRSNEQVPAAK
jgi:hypothetical protein